MLLLFPVSQCISPTKFSFMSAINLLIVVVLIANKRLRKLTGCLPCTRYISLTIPQGCLCPSRSRGLLWTSGSPWRHPRQAMEVSGQSDPHETSSEGPRTSIVGDTDTPMKIIISDQNIGGNPSQGRWSLLTFTNQSLTKSARWETQTIRQGGTAYRDLRKAERKNKQRWTRGRSQVPLGIHPRGPPKEEGLMLR